MLKKLLIVVLVVSPFLLVSQQREARAYELSTLDLGGVATTKFNGLVQAWTVGNENSTTQDQGTRLRRLELKLTGQIARAPKYFFMIDPARLIVPPGGRSIATANMFQDMGVSYAVIPGLELTAGQFKIPTMAEGLDSSADLSLPERSLVGRNYGDRREIGFRAALKQELFNVASMVSTGQNVAFEKHQSLSELHTRAEVTPIKELGIGTFVSMGNDFNYTSKGRWGTNARYKISRADLRVEYAQGNDSGVNGHGVTTEAGYWILPNLEPVARYETFSPNAKFGTSAKAETLGVNYFLREYNTKLQLAGSALQNMSAVNGSPAATKGVDNKLVTLVVQASL